MSMNTDKELKEFGKKLIAKYWYDIIIDNNTFDFLKTRFVSKRETIKRFNKVVYGKK